MARWIIVCLLSLLWASPQALSSHVPEELLNPTTYHSEDKTFSVKVIPTTKHGAGGAHYVFYKNGEIAWEKDMDFTLRDVKITFNGRIVGYSYNTGEYSYDEHSKLSLWLLNAEGTIFYSTLIPRDMPIPLHSPPRPTCRGILLQEKFDNAIFRISPAPDNEDALEKWIVISIGTGQTKASIYPALKNAERMRISRILTFPELPYFFIALEGWGSYPSQANKAVHYSKTTDSLFVLLDAKGRIIWEDRNPDDLDFEILGCSSEQIDAYLDKNDLVGMGNKPNEFWISHLKNKERIFYALSDDGRVKELNRDVLHWLDALATPKQEAKKHDEIVYHNGPKHLYSFQVIEKPAGEQPPQNILVFAFDTNNKAGCIAREENGYFFYLIGLENKLLASQKLSIEWGNLSPSSLQHAPGGSWLLLASNSSNNSRLFELSPKGILKREITINAPGGGRMVVDANANITLLASKGGNYLRQFDRNGKERWTFDENFAKPGGLLSPEDIVLTAKNEIVVLDNIAQNLQFYNLSGKYLKTMELKKTKSGEINYPTYLAVDASGIIYVKEEAGKFRIHKYAGDRGYLGAISLQHKSGKPVGYIRDMRFDRTGQLWVSDKVMLSVDAQGHEVKSLGASLNEEFLRHISWMDTDSKGNLYIFDEGSYAIAQFSPEGKKIKTFGVPKSDIPPSGIRSRQMFVDADDLISTNIGGAYVRFNPSGKEVDRKKLFPPSDFGAPDILARKDRAGYWSLAYDVIYLLDHEGEEILEIKKGADGNWLDGVTRIYTDHTGKLLVTGYRSPVFVFDSDGKPIRTIHREGKWTDLSEVSIAGNYIYFSDPDQRIIRVLNLEGKEVAIFPSPDKLPPHFSKPYRLHADGRSNRLFIADQAYVHVFELIP